jgi:TatD DNase family protein
MIDFHAHLDLYSDPVAVVERCRQEGTYVLSVTTTPSAWLGTKRLAAEAPRIRTALGLHPQVAHLRIRELSLFDTLLANSPYVGEIGLEGGREWRPHYADQLTVFDHILKSCEREGGRVLSIHSRQAAKDVLNMLESHPKCGTPILHWFTGSHKELERAIALGCWFSVGPAMLKSSNGKNLATAMPRDRVLTETDGPFGKIQQRSLMPSDAFLAIPMLAQLWKLSESATSAYVRKALRQIGELAGALP